MAIFDHFRDNLMVVFAKLMREVEFVDLRFTDTIGTEHHITVTKAVVDEAFLTEGKCLMGHPLKVGAQSLIPIWY